MSKSKERIEKKQLLNQENHDCSNTGKGLKFYIDLEDNVFVASKSFTTKDKLPPGIYNIEWNEKHQNWQFVKMEVLTDELLKLPNKTFNTIVDDIDYFWKNKDIFQEYKYTYKRGILLYGPPGCGKTCLISLLIEQMIKLNGVVLNIKSCDDLSIFASAIPQTFRIIERDTPLIVVIEDIEGLCNENNRSETTLLNILDGNLQIDNCIYIGCTNFPEKLKERILNRPSRFDKRYYIGLPNREVRKFYLKSKIKQNDLESINLDELVDKTEGLSLAHLGELIKSVFIFKKNIEETLQELFDMREFITSTKFENKSRIGFRNNEIPKLLENEEVDRSENELPHCR